MYKDRESRILEAYVDGYGKGMHVREIAKKLKISPSAVSYMTKLLEKGGIFKHTTEGRNKKYFINFGDPAAKGLLAAAEIAKRTFVMEKHFIIKKLASEISMRSSIVLLFGSYAKDTAGEGSDIDVLIIGKNKALETELDKFGKLYKKQVQVMSMQENDLMRGGELVNEIMKSHIILNNAEGFVNIIWRMKYEG